MLNFDNTDCLGNSLTYNKPCSFSARITNNNNIQFDSNTYICFGNKEQFTNIYKMTFNINESLLTAPTSGIWYICSNILSNGNYRLKRLTYNYETLRLEALVNDTLYSFGIAFPNQKSGTITIELSNTGVPSITIINRKTINPTTSTLIEEDDGCAYFNAYKLKNSDINIGVFTFNINYALNLINTDNNIIHMYKFAEGEGNIVYDSVSDVHGRLSNITARYIDHIYKYPYNTLDGFRQDIEIDNALVKAKIPLNKNLVIYKSIFNTNTIDDWKNGYGISDCSINNGNLQANATSVDTISRIQLTNLNLTENQLNRKFHIKYKITNTNPNTLTSIYITIGSDFISSHGLGYTPQNKAIVNLLTNESHEDEFDLTIGNGLEFSPIYQIVCNYNNTLVVDDPTFNVEYFEISQVNHLLDFPKITNGKNASESTLDYTRTIENIAELKNIDFIKTGPIFYSKQWYVSNFENSIDNWIESKGVLSYNNDKLLITLSNNNELKNIQCWHGVLDGYNLYNSFRNGVWHLKCKIYNENTTNWNNQIITFYIGGSDQTNSIAKLSLSLNILSGQNNQINTDFDSIYNTNMFYVNTLLTMNIDSGFVENTTTERKIGLSDIEITFTPNELSYEPMYVKFDKYGNYSNILIYDKPQTEFNLKRIKNYIRNY